MIKLWEIKRNWDLIESEELEELMKIQILKEENQVEVE